MRSVPTPGASWLRFRDCQAADPQPGAPMRLQQIVTPKPCSTV
jgi:hypothetical protein